MNIKQYPIQGHAVFLWHTLQSHHTCDDTQYYSPQVWYCFWVFFLQQFYKL